MNASSGGVNIGYLEKQPFAKIVWLSRAAEISMLQRHLDMVYAINAGYSGDQKRLDKIQQRMDFLLLTEVKTDVDKLQKLKKMTGEKRAKARKDAEKRKKRKKWISLSLKKDN